MKLLIGLGNPEGPYTKTRHNAGYMVIDRLLGKFAKSEPLKSRFHSACIEANISGEKMLLMKPITYMNRSGLAVIEAVNFYKIDIANDLLIIVDDLYLPTGAIRLKPSGGPGGHNGLIDVQRALGADTYPRLRIGVGMRPNGGKPPMMDQADFVLSRFVAEEASELETSLDRAAQAAELFVTRGLAAAMNTFNAKESAA